MRKNLRKIWQSLGAALVACFLAAESPSGCAFHNSASLVYDPSPRSFAAVAAWKSSVQPIVRAHCEKCHATSQSPFFAAPNPDDAYREAVLSGKINLWVPEKSRLVQRLKTDFHNCWGDCAANAAEMQAAIENCAAANGVKRNGGGTEGLVLTSEVPIPAGLGATPVTLSFPLQDLVTPPIPGLKLDVSIKIFDSFSYQIFNPRISSTGATPVYVKEINVILNGLNPDTASTYRGIDEVVNSTSTAKVLSPASLILEIDKGAGVDKVMLGFRALVQGTGAGLAAQRFQTALAMIKTNCASCHSAPLGVGPVPAFANFTTEAEFLAVSYEGAGLIVKNSSANSALFKSVTGVTTPVMPPGRSNGTAVSLGATLSTWIDQIP